MDPGGLVARLLGRGREPGRFVRACALYAPVEGETALVAAMFNHGGLFAERDDGVVAVPARDAVAIGRAVREALDGTVYETEFNYRESKKTDWPAFRASGCRSVAAFERQFGRFYITGSDASNTLYRIESPVIGRFSLRLTAEVAADVRAAEFAAAMEAVVAAWRKELG